MNKKQIKELLKAHCTIENGRWVFKKVDIDAASLELEQALQQTPCSTQLPPSDFDLERLYEWVMDENRRPAKTAFTSGLLRKVADEIEFRLWRQLS